MSNWLHNKEMFRVPRVRRVLVLAPHPDDESVGCGGYLAALADQDAEITVVFVTDGGLGPAGLDQSLVLQRRAESEAASRILGVRHVVRWHMLDGQLVSRDMPAELLENLLTEMKIELVLMPHLGESHSDHVAVAHLPGQVESTACDNVIVMAYEVWTPLSPNCSVNITAKMHKKLCAVRAYGSQRERFKLEMLATGLGQYRAAWSRMRGWEHAECFQRYRLAQYREVCHAYRRWHPEYCPGAAEASGHRDR